jgi:hypothetical protein
MLRPKSSWTTSLNHHVPGQKFDIFVYLKRQGGDGHVGLDEVRRADIDGGQEVRTAIDVRTHL